MIALMPETAACTTHLPSSTARSRLMMRCWRDAAVRSYDALLIVTTRNRAPALMKARSSAGKLFS
jgi:hypothetical protein